MPRDKVELLYLQKVCERISELPQATIAKIEGFARGGGHEFALAYESKFQYDLDNQRQFEAKLLDIQEIN